MPASRWICSGCELDLKYYRSSSSLSSPCCYALPTFTISFLYEDFPSCLAFDANSFCPSLRDNLLSNKLLNSFIMVFSPPCFCIPFVCYFARSLYSILLSMPSICCYSRMKLCLNCFCFESFCFRCRSSCFISFRCSSCIWSIICSRCSMS